ncbi:lipopolysaccharide biosynthesis protein [Candidatus Nitrosacidococcus sp. I8]|uniref:lipopolysaccharide biosynthesis protein n=1 Tax=Candidatus Nitrosacidococcus sp. I8 TaxID=2942908 RepID=UPI0022269A2E|nr:lipopolysaccharide biosynthesis protein [Candidatus Nitrosacidococcus sp. I8]CAH9019187.1 Lipopolysaccharide biosynthesis protein WzxC [Candidatus Nitrosacidococcus sp. I8]
MLSVRKSLLLSSIQRYASTILALISTMILSRILTPEEIGIFSIATILVAVINSVREFGIGEYVTYEPNLTKEKLRTAQGISLLVMWSLGLIILILAQPAAEFYKEPGVGRVMIVLSMSSFLLPFGNVVMAYWHREMDFNRTVSIDLSALTVRFIFVIILAFLGFSYMSMAWAQVASMVTTIALAAYFRPKWFPIRPSMKEAKSIASFSSKAMGINITKEISDGSTDLVLGRLLDVAAVGIFSRALGVVSLFQLMIVESIRLVVQPYFSAYNRQGGDIVHPYLKTMTYITGLAWPFYINLFFFADPIIQLLYGSQWSSSVPVAKILCISGIFQILAAFNPNLCIALGNPSLPLKINTISGILKFFILILIASYGLQIAAIGVVIATIIEIILWLTFLKTFIVIDTIQYIQALNKSVYVTLMNTIPIVLVWFIYRDFTNIPISKLIIIACSIFGTWLLALRITQHPLYCEIAQIPPILWKKISFYKK